jgi:curved DNA-binding protein CbpA
MKKEEIILQEIQELKAVIARLVGTDNLPKEQQFSIEAINKAEEEFKKLTRARDEWIDEEGFGKYLKARHYDAGKVVRQEFSFTSYYKKGYNYFYKKKDILAFSKELKNRNIDSGMSN